MNGGSQTTHYCVADGKGDVVSVTVTLNDLFGSKVVVEGAGFFLNDEMDDFVTAPGVPNLYGLTGGTANSIAPGKRMLSTMTPTIVLKDGRPFLAVGGRGGSRIATAVTQVILNVIDFGLGIQEAVDAPRVHHQWLPDVLYYEQGIVSGTVSSLERFGYQCKPAAIGEIEALLIDPASGKIYGAPDPREGESRLGTDWRKTCPQVINILIHTVIHIQVLSSVFLYHRHNRLTFKQIELRCSVGLEGSG